MTVGHEVVGKAVVEVAGEVEGATVGDAQGSGDGLRTAVEEGVHLGGRLEVELVVGAALAVSVFQRLALLDGHQAVLQAMTLRDMVVDVVGGNYSYTQLLSKGYEAAVATGIAVDQVLLEFEEIIIRAEPVDMTAGYFRGFFHSAFGGQLGNFSSAAAGESDEALGMFGQHAGVKPGMASLAEYMGGGDEAAEVGVALARFGQQSQVTLIIGARPLEGDLGTDDGMNVQGAGGAGELHGPAQVVVVGEGQGGVAQSRCASQQLVGEGCSFLEGEVAVAVQFDVGGITLSVHTTRHRSSLGTG